jgi:hypothetical protein
MAKKKSEQQGEGGKDRTLCIKMVHNPKNDAYFFKEDVVPNEKVEEFFQGEEKSQEEASN